MAGEVSKCMTEKWVGLRGFTVVSTALESLTVCDKDMRTVQTVQRAKINRDPAMAAATLTTAQADAMTEAARNENGGFVAVRAVYPPAPVHPAPMPNVSNAPAASTLPNVTSAPTVEKIPNVPIAPNPQPVKNMFLEPDDSEKPKLWYCTNCRKMLTSKFCPDCGAKRKG